MSWPWNGLKRTCEQQTAATRTDLRAQAPHAGTRARVVRPAVGVVFTGHLVRGVSGWGEACLPHSHAGPPCEKQLAWLSAVRSQHRMWRREGGGRRRGQRLLWRLRRKCWLPWVPRASTSTIRGKHFFFLGA